MAKLDETTTYNYNKIMSPMDSMDLVNSTYSTTEHT